VLRDSVKAGVACAILALVAAGSALADSGPGEAAAPDDAATSIYVEQVPVAGGTSGGAGSGTESLEQLLTSPALGAPQRVQSPPGAADRPYGTFSVRTVREVAGVGTARLAVLLAVLALTALTLGTAALRSAPRRS
jgi:hypothetical protein